MRELRANPPEDVLPTDIPSNVRPMVTRFKHELRDVIARVLNLHPAMTPQVLRESVMGELRSMGIGPQGSEPSPLDFSADAMKVYAYLDDVQVRQPTRNNNLMGVVTTLQIPCGSDSSLYLFELRGTTWELILADESNDYETIAGGQGSFQYAVSPPSEDGSWFVVAADVNPWCTSNWQGLRYKVMRPGVSPDHPQILLQEHRGVFLDFENNFKLTLNPAGFQISQIASQSLDAAILTRVHIQKYKVSRDQVKRIAPIALLPQDFLDEWYGMQWEEASQWVSPSVISAARKWHSRLQEDVRKNFSTEFLFVQPCPTKDDSQEWQIGLSIETTGESDPPEGLPGEVFFTVVRRDGAFYLAGIDTDRPAGCPGEKYPISTPLDWKRLP